MVWCTASVLDAVAFAEGFKVFEGELGALIQVGHNYVANRHRSFCMVFAAAVVDISDTSGHSE